MDGLTAGRLMTFEIEELTFGWLLSWNPFAKGFVSKTLARTEKLARRNPARIQRQIDALVEERDRNAGVLRPRDKELLEKLEREAGAIRRARERAGVAPSFASSCTFSGVRL